MLDQIRTRFSFNRNEQICICRLQPFSEDTLGGGNLRGPNIPVP
jgi:hypothetical protein